MSAGGVEWTRPSQDDLGRMTTADLGLPHWADNTARALLTDDDAAHAWVYLAGSHERVLTRLDNGTVYIDNRGRGLTTLTATEASDLAMFLLGGTPDPEGTEWGVRTGERVLAFGTSDGAEDAAYRTAEAYDDKGTPADVVRRDRLRVTTAWEAI